ncbi:MAG TPA: hypothetical protein VGI10_26315 [Polyangiaceae bacterium]|jgi:hypothetical protein
MTQQLRARWARNVLALVALACAGCGARFSTESADEAAAADSGAGGTGGGTSITCTDGQDQFLTLRNDLLTPDATTCMVDSDCVFLQELPECMLCGAAVINTWSAPSLQPKLDAFGKTACANCPGPPSSCSEPFPATPYCYAGQCYQTGYRS